MPHFEVYENVANHYRWKLDADDGEVLATSGQDHHSREACLDSVEAFMDGNGDYE